MAFVDLYKLLFLKSTCDMDLMWLHVDSVSIYILKSQSRNLHHLNQVLEVKARNEQILSQKDIL